MFLKNMHKHVKINVFFCIKHALLRNMCIHKKIIFKKHKSNIIGNTYTSYTDKMLCNILVEQFMIIYYSVKGNDK